MKLIKINQAKEGMISADNIRDSIKGNVLVEEGDILDSQTISKLIKAKISKIKIYTSSDNEKINQIKLLRKHNVKSINELEEKVITKRKDQFLRVINNRLMKKIFDKTIEYDLKQLGIK